MGDEPRRGDPSSPTLRQVFQGRRGGFLVALLLAEFAAAMQGIAYSTVLPITAADLDGFALFGATLAAGSISAVVMLSYAGPILARVRPSVALLVATVLYVIGAALAVFAPTMTWVLAGTVVRGLAAGLLGGFGLGAIGALFDERERPRVFGLFAMIWLLPSIVGPALNAVVTEFAGWRWALAWPAILVVAARIGMGAFVSTVPFDERKEPIRGAVGLVVAAALVLGSWGSTTPTALGRLALGAGLVIGAVAIAVFLRRGRGATRSLVAFALLCAVFFGMYELIALTVIEGLGSDLLWTAVAVSAGLLGWSLAGLRPAPNARPDRVVVGAALIAVSLGAVVTALLVGGDVAPLIVVGGAAGAGVGMGLAYPILSSEPFSADIPASTGGALIAFAETAGTAWAVLLSGGLYSALHTSGWTPDAALLAVFGALGAVAAATIVSAAVRRRRRVAV